MTRGTLRQYFALISCLAVGSRHSMISQLPAWLMLNLSLSGAKGCFLARLIQISPTTHTLISLIDHPSLGVTLPDMIVFVLKPSRSVPPQQYEHRLGMIGQHLVALLLSSDPRNLFYLDSQSYYSHHNPNRKNSFLSLRPPCLAAPLPPEILPTGSCAMMIRKRPRLIQGRAQPATIQCVLNSSDSAHVMCLKHGAPSTLK